MYCKHCGNYLPDDAVMCDICGEMAHRDSAESGVRSMRQGRHGDAPPQVLPDEKRDSVPEYGDYEMSPLPPEQQRGVRRANNKKADGYSRPETRSGVPVHGSVMTRYVTTSRKKPKGMQYHRFNWMLLLLIILVLMVMAVVGYFIYMKVTDNGQRITARKRVLMTTEEMLTLAVADDNNLLTEQEEVLDYFNTVPAQTYWLVGEDYEALGDMELAIRSFRIADILDPENYDGLYMLATVYELDSQNELAEEVYNELINTVSPSRTDAYTALISLMISEDRDPEAADLMLLAYENTGSESFNTQRDEFIPEKPEVDAEQTAGRYEFAQNIVITSPQGYDIYYTTDDDAVLPDDGILLEGNSVLITEGTVTLRAICVVDDLQSDEFSGKYIVYYPSPSAPKANVAPGTYSKLKSVKLRAGEKSDNYSDLTDDQKAMEDDLTFYYTFDGSDPDPDYSPIYDGTAIDLPTGRVYLRAIVVNGYGKESATMEIYYKFTVKPYLEEPYSSDDTFRNAGMEETLLDDFTAQFGEPNSTESIQYLYYDGSAQQLNYNWGSAVFILSGNSWELVRLDVTSNISTPPRSVGIGDSESTITAAYKDFGMPDNRDGTRSLYYSDPDIGKIELDDDGNRMIQYTAESIAGNVMQLQYYLDSDGICYRVVNFVRE